MGYELHITRAADWASSESSPITESEWLAATGADGRIKRYPGNSEFTWRSADGPAMYWVRDQINIKGVRDAAEIGEIATFAETLNARLEGDDGETYDAHGQPTQ